MSPVRIKPRALSKPCPVCGKSKHLQVVFRMGGRGFPEIAAGSFHYDKDARSRRDFIAGELAAGRNPIESLKQITAAPAAPRRLDQVVTGYKASRIDYSTKSAKGAASHLTLLLEILGPDTAPETIDVTRCIDTVAVLAGRLAPSSVVKYVSTLKQLLDYAGVDPNPARDPRVKLPTVKKTEPEPPDAAHVQAILGRVPERVLLPLLTLEQTAMTIGEAVALEWSDVDVPGRRFRLRRSTVKGQIAARARWVQLPDWLMAAIEATCAPEDRSTGRRVFPRLTVDAAEKAMRGACLAAQIPHFTPHDLRHRRLSLWHGQGIPAKELAARAGHTDAHMTLNTYSHVMPLDEVPADQLLAIVGGAS